MVIAIHGRELRVVAQFADHWSQQRVWIPIGCSWIRSVWRRFSHAEELPALSPRQGVREFQFRTPRTFKARLEGDVEAETRS